MLDPLLYNRIFQRDKDGASILEELASLFYDRPGYQLGGSVNDTIYKEGQRSVVAFIMNKAGDRND